MAPKTKRRIKKIRNEKPKSPHQATKINEEMLERILFRWYQKYQQRKKENEEEEAADDETISPETLLAKAQSIVDKVDCTDDVKEKLNLDWIHHWQKLYGVTDETQGIDLRVTKPIEEEGSEIYYLYCFTLNFKGLPSNQVTENENDLVSILMAANKTGTHRTRVLVTGKQWRPPCLKHVNMVTQPVIYAGGGNSIITPELFKWWFSREFDPVVSILYPKTILFTNNSGFLEIITEANPRVTIQLNETNDFQNIVRWEFRTILTSMILRNYLNFKSIESIDFNEYMSNLTIKDAFLFIHRAWLHIRPETFPRAVSTEEATTRKSKLVFNRVGSEVDLQGDNNLLLELQWMTHDLGLEVTDDDLLEWVFGTKPEVEVKVELVAEVSGISEEDGSVDKDIVDHLEKVIFWMESEPFDSNLLLCMQDVLAYAKKVNRNTNHFIKLFLFV